MLEKTNCRIRAVEHTDLALIKEIRMSTHVQTNVHRVLFFNEESQKKWLDRLEDSDKKFYAILEVKLDEWTPVGYIKITQIDHMNKSMCVGGDIKESYCGKGYSKLMYDLIFQLGFDVWGMNRLWLEVLEENTRAQSIYKKLGFKKEGVLRKAVFKEGKYQDSIVMSLLRNETRGD